MTLKPLPLKRAILFFWIPTLVVALNVYVFMAYLSDEGLPFFFNIVIVYSVLPMLLLIFASYFFFKNEGDGASWASFKVRMRLNPMSKTDWLWTLGLLIFMVVTAGGLSFTSAWILSFDFIPFPDYWPADIKPSQGGMENMTLPSEFMGMPLAGNWWILPTMGGSLIIATLGEELWWRGYILPRQELAGAKNTWITHGLLWTSFHLFAPWNIISILPGCLALSYVAQRLKNTWPGIIAHGLANGLLVMIIIFMGIIK